MLLEPTIVQFAAAVAVPEVTLRYSHLSQQHKKKAVDALGRVFDGHFLDTQPKMAACAGFNTSRKGLIPKGTNWHAWQDSNLRPTD